MSGIFDPLDKNCYDFRKLFRKLPLPEKNYGGIYEKEIDCSFCSCRFIRKRGSVCDGDRPAAELRSCCRASHYAACMGACMFRKVRRHSALFCGRFQYSPVCLREIGRHPRCDRAARSSAYRRLLVYESRNHRSVALVLGSRRNYKNGFQRQREKLLFVDRSASRCRYELVFCRRLFGALRAAGDSARAAVCVRRGRQCERRVRCSRVLSEQRRFALLVLNKSKAVYKINELLKNRGFSTAH